MAKAWSPCNQLHTRWAHRGHEQAPQRASQAGAARPPSCMGAQPSEGAEGQRCMQPIADALGAGTFLACCRCAVLHADIDAPLHARLPVRMHLRVRLQWQSAVLLSGAYDALRGRLLLALGLRGLCVALTPPPFPCLPVPWPLPALAKCVPSLPLPPPLACSGCLLAQHTATPGRGKALGVCYHVKIGQAKDTPAFGILRLLHIGIIKDRMV